MSLIYRLRALLAGFLFGLYTSFFGSLIILLSFFNLKVVYQNWLVWAWAELSLRTFGIKVIATGLENIPLKGALFLFNHTSHFDILILQSQVPRLRFGAKIELFKIPIFGTAMRRAGVLPITRQNREKVFQIYDEASSRVERGACFALAPEGTRQQSEKLGPFKTGPFIFSINSKMPIVPVAIKGAISIMPKHSIIPRIEGWQKEVRIHFSENIPVSDYTIEKRFELQEKVRNVLEKSLDSIDQSH